MELIEYYQEPILRDPILIAAWPGMGDVAISAANYLKDELAAEELASILPYDFYEPGMVPIQNSVVGDAQFPQNKFYHWKSDGPNTGSS